MGLMFTMRVSTAKDSPARRLSIFLVYMHSVVLLMRGGYWTELWTLARKRMYSDSEFFVLRCDLTAREEISDAGTPVTIRPMRKADARMLLDLEGPGITGRGVRERVRQWRLLEAGLQTGYVGVTLDDRPCFMAWLVGPAQNSLIEAYFKGSVAPLRVDEMLLEGVLTLEQFRGRNVMQSAAAQLRGVAAASGARWMLAYVDQRNEAALRAFARSGYVPCSLRHERWRFGRRKEASRPVTAQALVALDRLSPVRPHA